MMQMIQVLFPAHVCWYLWSFTLPAAHVLRGSRIGGFRSGTTRVRVNLTAGGMAGMSQV